MEAFVDTFPKRQCKMDYPRPCYEGCTSAHISVSHYDEIEHTVRNVKWHYDPIAFPQKRNSLPKLFNDAHIFMTLGSSQVSLGQPNRMLVSITESDPWLCSCPALVLPSAISRNSS